MHAVCRSAELSRKLATCIMALKLAKVLISDSVDSSCREILESNGVPVDYKPGMSKEDLLAVVKVSMWCSYK